MEQEIKQLMQQLKPEFLAFVKLWNWFRTEFETETLWSIDDAVEKHEDFTIGRFAHYYTKKNPDNISYPLMATACYLKQNNVAKAKEYSDSVLRKISDKSSLDYKMLRMYHDQLGDMDVVLAVQKERNNAVSNGAISSKSGKYLYYLALYYDIRGDVSLAQKYYVEVCSIQSPMFFEYRLAKWAKNPDSDDTVREVNASN